MSPDALPNHPACGWTNNDFAAYSSKDLVSWRLESPSILPADQRPNGIYFRPKVMYNAKTEKFVLWMNYVTEGWDQNGTDFEHQHWSTLATAVSDSPEGPYSFVGGHLPPIVMGTGNASCTSTRTLLLMMCGSIFDRLLALVASNLLCLCFMGRF